MQRQNGQVTPRAIAWVDVETTSLDVTHPDVLLLELAIVVTDQDLVERARLSRVVSWSREEVERAQWHPVARGMHETSGLLLEVQGPDAVPLAQVEREMIDLLARHAGVNPTEDPDRKGSGAERVQAPLWGGCSTWIDRTIVRRLMPRLYERIHYRTIDATTLKLAAELWYGDVTSRPTPHHRALEDAIAAARLADRVRMLMLQHGSSFAHAL